MFITVHAAAGGAIGQFIHEPWLAFGIGFASHFVLDMIPHGDEGIIKWKWFKTVRNRIIAASALDFLALLCISSIWLYTVPAAQFPGMVYGMAGAILPDALWGFHELTGAPFLNWYRRLHSNMHDIFKSKLNIKQGFFIQIPLLIILTLLLIAF